MRRRRHSSSSPKKNWSAHLFVQKILPKRRLAQLSQTHLKQIGHLLSRLSWSLTWQTTHSMGLTEYSTRPPAAPADP
jgi:hypothetical protein